ncbi:MAG: hypothetical protein EU521_00680 [Promethearchaeota archaeon]|nr:MAG: hypothetical protein EU521_00680 [Candidatus Lokiarchaeota archaeon]
MSEYIINDQWVLDKVSSESKSFSSWLNNLMNTIEKSLGEKNPEALAKFKKEKNLHAIKNLDTELANAQKDLEEAQKELDNLGILGKAFKGFGQNIFKKVTQSMGPIMEKSMISTIGDDLDMDLDWVTGKRKDLSSVLYDVTKERGINYEGILYLIKSLPDLEAFLYSTNVRKYYRDHTEHALRVAVLGDFLLEQDFGSGELLGIISELTEIDKDKLKNNLWWITGLLHDIGYPLGKMSTAVNYSLMNQLLKCYPTLDLKFSPIEIGLSWEGKQKEYLEIIEEGLSIEAKILIREGVNSETTKAEFPKPKIQNFVTNRNGKGHPEFTYKSPIKLDHGVISALCLLNSLGSPEEIKENDDYIGYIKVAQAIALHNFKTKLNEYIFDKQPLAFFLMLIDELQEWGRPIPIQVRDTYFTTQLEKINLLDEIILHLDEFSWFMKFKNQKAKKLMNFDFDLFSTSKKKAFNRLDRGNKFTETIIRLQDIKSNKEKKEIVRESEIHI